jgi:hypothetical protein
MDDQQEYTDTQFTDIHGDVREGEDTFLEVIAEHDIIDDDTTGAEVPR